MKREYIEGLFNDAGSNSHYKDQHLMLGWKHESHIGKAAKGNGRNYTIPVFTETDRRKQGKSLVWVVGVPA